MEEQISSYYYVHPSSDVKTKDIGDDTKIWQYCVVFPHARIGKNCNICANVLIENDVQIGNNVTVKSGVQLWDGVHLEDDVFIGPNVTFTNDIYPRSKEYPEKFERTVIKRGASIGANSTILPGITIGEYAMIGAGSVVTKDVPAFTLWYGNPAKQIRYISLDKKRMNNNKNDVIYPPLIKILSISGLLLN